MSETEVRFLHFRCWTETEALRMRFSSSTNEVGAPASSIRPNSVFAAFFTVDGEGLRFRTDVRPADVPKKTKD